MYVQRVGVDDLDECVEYVLMICVWRQISKWWDLEVWDFEKQNNEMCLKWRSLKNKIIFEIVSGGI